MNGNRSFIRPLVGIIFVLLVSHASLGQQYKSVRTSGRVFYEGGGEMHTVQVVSMQDLGNNDTIFSFYTVVDTGTGLPGSCNLVPDAAGWLGQRMVVQDSLINLFFNAQGDTIRFRPGAALGNVYPIYYFPNGDYLEATNTGLAFDVFIDSFSRFKTIQLQARNSTGQAIPHAMNGKTMEFSERFGMKKGFNLRHFPHDTTTYRLIGHELSGLGQRPLQVFTVFDIRPGFEFHFVERLNGRPYLWEKQFVWNAFDIGNSDTLQLEIERWRKRYLLDGNGAVVDTLFTQDTLIDFIPYAAYSFLNGSHRQVFEYSPDTFGYALHRLIDSLGPRFRKDIQRPYTLSFGGGCLQAVTDSTLVEHYGDGLGRTAWHVSRSNGDLWQRDMVYYQVGIAQWGDFIDFPPLGRRIQQREALQIIPNPATDQFSFSAARQPGLVRLYSATGQLVLARHLSSAGSVGVAHLPAGLYWVLLEQGDRVLSGKLVKR